MGLILPLILEIILSLTQNNHEYGLTPPNNLEYYPISGPEYCGDDKSYAILMHFLCISYALLMRFVAIKNHLYFPTKSVNICHLENTTRILVKDKPTLSRGFPSSTNLK